MKEQLPDPDNLPRFVFPESLLRQILECSPRGFILLTVDEKGNPQPYSAFEDKLSQIALVHYLSAWAQGTAFRSDMIIGESAIEDPEEE